MTIFEFGVTYACCWWLVLFMVLPYKAEASKSPGLGHAPSAPANPRLRQKFKWVTVLAIIPAVAMYFIVSEAKAAESIYHAGGGCKPRAAYTPSDDVDAKDGYATGGKKVKPANLESANPYVPEKYDIPLRVPGGNYIKSHPGDKRNLDDSFISAGQVSVSKDGKTTLNGKPVEPQDVPAEDCGDDPESTK